MLNLLDRGGPVRVLPPFSGMKPNLQNQPETTTALPMQVGMTSQQTEDVIQEISHSGVAKGEADVERDALPGPETGENNAPSGFPMPIITSD
ncbi:MAG TPA: hypothetical protein VF627_06105 [Abditibacterium sp.]|jgi:formaldehyde-activating enzyme involved in methanogenesis